MGPGSRFAWPGRRELPHHPRTKSGLAPRWRDFLFQETMRLPADVPRPRIGPGPALVFGGAGRLAGLGVLGVFQLETAIVAAKPLDRRLDRPASALVYAPAAHP